MVDVGVQTDLEIQVQDLIGDQHLLVIDDVVQYAFSLYNCIDNVIRARVSKISKRLHTISTDYSAFYYYSCLHTGSLLGWIV
jgi:hypothetical protein